MPEEVGTMSHKSRIWVALGFFTVFTTTSKAAESPQLFLIWNDAYKLLPISCEGIGEEVTEIFEALGIRVSWTKAGQREVTDTVAVQVRVILMPKLSSKWSLPEHTMGVVIGEKVPRESVFISYSGVLRTMGFEPTPDRKRSPKERAELTRALGRVIAHELAHAIVPERDHDSDGLLAANLKRSHLKKSSLRFADDTASAFVRKLTPIRK
jgi:hypothetical protein